MIYRVHDKADFKKANLENWYKNSEFWMESKMRHLLDIYEFTGQLLGELQKHFSSSNVTLFDLGCGEGWIYRLIQDYNLSFKYRGFDFNEVFVNANNQRYKCREGQMFVHYDLEDNPPFDFLASADIAINAFNFFEIPDIERAFSNASKMIRKNGILVVISIDPIMQILSVSKTFDEFKQALSDYEKDQTQLGYDKDIDIGDERSGRIYKSLLYSTATYVEIAKRNDLNLFDYREVVRTGNFVPQIYQFILFRK